MWQLVQGSVGGTGRDGGGAAGLTCALVLALLRTRSRDVSRPAASSPVTVCSNERDWGSLGGFRRAVGHQAPFAQHHHPRKVGQQVQVAVQAAQHQPSPACPALVS